MPSSWSAKEICREHGEGSISCKVAKKREARRKRREEEYGEVETPKPPPKKPPPKKPPPEKPERGKKRRRYLEEKIAEGEGVPPPNKT